MDERLRRLVRQWQVSGDPDLRMHILAALMRGGSVPHSVIQFLKLLGLSGKPDLPLLLGFATNQINLEDDDTEGQLEDDIRKADNRRFEIFHDLLQIPFHRPGSRRRRRKDQL